MASPDPHAQAQLNAIMGAIGVNVSDLSGVAPAPAVPPSSFHAPLDRGKALEDDEDGIEMEEGNTNELMGTSTASMVRVSTNPRDCISFAIYLSAHHLDLSFHRRAIGTRAKP